MKKKRVLIITQKFYPDLSPRSFRATELAKEFSRQGHDVVVMLPNLDSDRILFAKKHGFNIINLGKRKWKTPNFGNSGLGYVITRVISRILQLAFEYPDIELMFMVKKALKNENNYDLLISIAVPYPIHWGVAWARTKRKKIATTWVADCGDPYMGCDTDSFKKWFYFSYIEKWFMRKTEFIVVPIKPAPHHYYPEFHNKIKVIPQGFKIDFMPCGSFKKNKVPTFAYAGGFIPGLRDPRPFLNFLSKINYDFIFIIYTRHTAILRGYDKILKSKLQIREYIPRDELLKILSQMDFLVNFDNNTPNTRPSKLIDYMIAGRPILNITKEFDENTVLQFLEGNYSKAYSLGSIEDFKIENVCKQFLSLADASK